MHSPKDLPPVNRILAVWISRARMIRKISPVMKINASYAPISPEQATQPKYAKVIPAFSLSIPLSATPMKEKNGSKVTKLP